MLRVMAHALSSEDARRELHELRVEELSDFFLAGVAMALSLTATRVAPAFAVPLFLGGLVVLVLAVRAACRRWELSERLLLDPDAYEIDEIRARAEQLASLQERRRLAWSIRALLAEPGPYRGPTVQPVADQLAELANELDDEQLALDPIYAVRCRHLVNDVETSALLNPALPSDGLRVTIARIRSGFEPRR
jgi:hypothetical protein